MSIKVAVSIVSLCLIFALLAVSIAYRSGKSGETLRILPNSESVAGLSVGAIDEINENDFTITYICANQASVSALDKNIGATVVGTNYSYLFALGLNIVNGGFFTLDMQKHGDKSAVLNKRAAFDMFGGYDVTGSEMTFSGDRYMVLGVLDDGSDNEAIVYIPSSLLNRSPSELICPLDESAGISAEYVKSKLKYLGITEDKYVFTNSISIGRLIENNFYAAVFLAVFCGSAVLLLWLIKFIKQSFAAAKKETENVYLRQYLSSNPGYAFKTAAALLGIAGCFLILAISAARLLEICLFWNQWYADALADAYFMASTALLLLFSITMALLLYVHHKLNSLHYSKFSVEK